ncbi:MAG: galactokinase [Clostridiales bacterium]|nr:galactokinase [Clostridiales bacterium]
MDLLKLYGTQQNAETQQKRLDMMKGAFAGFFGDAEGACFISAPGRTEIAGNHTDHNRGRVLAASVDLDTVALARLNGTDTVNLISDALDAPVHCDLTVSGPVQAEAGTSAALIRGMAAGLKNLGYKAGGFDAYVTSNVASGCGLSSSAAFEVMLGKTFSVLFNADALPAQSNASVAQWAENNYFMKPCGLMDQMASSVGGMVTIDFGETPALVEKIEYDFAEKGFCACVVSCGGEHTNLTGEYASIPTEMKQVARLLGGETLRDVEDRIETSIPMLKNKVPDRAILRALHFADENRRVEKLVACLKQDDLCGFLDGIIESGESSWKLLQNLYVACSQNQEMPLALEMSRRFLKGRGAWRVHGGGFAGTILAFVRLSDLSGYTAYMESVFGQGAVKPLYLRPLGAVRL